MKPAQIVKELIRAAEQLGLRVRFDRGNFRGGHCTLKREGWILLNKSHPAEAHIALLADALRDLPLDTVFLRPAVRSALDEAWASDTLIEADLPDAD